MSIGLRWEDENGNELASVDSLPASKFVSLIPPLIALDYPCLRYVDHYGDTTFNQLQIPQLADDLSRVLLRCEDDATRQQVETMLALVLKAAGQTHTYIKFYGD
jgi:hypothetical protein